MFIDQISRSTSEPVLLLPPLLPPEPPTTIDILSQPGSGIWDADEYFQSSPSTVLPFTPRYRQRDMGALEHVFRMAQNVNPALQGNSLTNAVDNGNHNGHFNTEAYDEVNPYQIIQTYLSSLTSPYHEISESLLNKNWPLKTIYALLTVLEQNHIHLLFTLRRKGCTESEIKEIEKLCRAHVT